MISDTDTWFSVLGRLGPTNLVLEMRIDSEADFSLEDYENSRLWDFEFVSTVQDQTDCSMTGI
jgi:hypothetical protein